MLDVNKNFNPNRQIAIIWSIEDILGLRSDLTEEQAFNVLKEIERRHDYTIGVNWDVIEEVANDLYPKNNTVEHTAENKDRPVWVEAYSNDLLRIKTWKEFKDAGLLWFINSILHLFGWAITLIIDTETNEVKTAFPARTKFRGFDQDTNSDGYKNVTKYIADNINELLKECSDDEALQEEKDADNK